MPIDQPFTCPVLIGRAAQLDALLRLAERAQPGHGHVALIAGEAGVGKSRRAIQPHFRGQAVEAQNLAPYLLTAPRTSVQPPNKPRRHSP